VGEKRGNESNQGDEGDAAYPDTAQGKRSHHDGGKDA
jgi:hypothetical protein